jgi:hypothetical protein
MLGSTSLLTGTGVLATGVGLTPTFTWEAPALGTPQGYRVQVMPAVASGSATMVGAVILTMYTSGLHAQIPLGVLQSGNYYLLRVTAISDATYHLEKAPQKWGKLPFGDAGNVTGLFTP